MTTQRKRVLWSLLVSLLINAFTWVVVFPELSRLPAISAAQSREKLVASVTTIRIERRSPARPPQPTPRPRAARSQTTSPPTPPPATLILPVGWTKQDFDYPLGNNTTLWLNWKKHTHTAFVPRVFLSQQQAELPYMRRPSLQDAVDRIVAALHAQKAELYANQPQRVCDGKYAGWFFSYLKPGDDPPIRVEETLFMAGDMVYRAMYVRPTDQPEDPETREALNTLC